ncbi:MAG: hydantoinase B/oxoprolinase family protein [Alphaproteobacteria bacterium]|nr:hydantoinase B/oxoprolinase family protein [Alphaproteobacteria bacterium]
MSTTHAANTAVDPITVSVIQHRLFGIVEEMGEAMLRTSYSQILNSSRDFSTCMCDAKARLVAQAEHIPVHVGALSFGAAAVQEYFGEDINPGDVFLLNDPYHGGSHLPDVTAFVPVFMAGKHAFWAINRAHHSDIGGATYGAYNPTATEIFQEGIRIPPLRLYETGKVRQDLLDMLATNTRNPRDFKGDLAAQIGSVKLGERRLQTLIEEFGPATVTDAIEAVLDGAERQSRAVVSEWADGVYEGEAVLDDDGFGRENIAIRARITKQGSDLTIDLSGSDPQSKGFLNSSYANMHSAVGIALAYLIDPETPKNDGSFRVLDVKAKQGTIVWAHEGAPVTMSTSHCSNEIIEAITVALSAACPERATAGWGRRFRIAIQGKHPTTGRTFIWHLFHARPGGGASSGGDGWHNGGEWHVVGGLKFGSVEVAEARFPLFFRHHEFRTDSMGDGKHRGGAGVDLELAVETEEPCVANMAGDGVRHGSRGILGGLDGKPHHYELHSEGKPPRVLKTKEIGLTVQPGDVFHVHSAGGGGWGDPSERDPAARERDRRQGIVSGSGD